MLQFLEDFFQELRNHDEITQTIVTLATLIGGLWLLVNVTLLVIALIKAAYLYGYARLVQLDLRKRYGHWAVITGATDGIGLGFAKELALRGHSLILVGRNQIKLESVKSQLSEIIKAPNEIITVKCDLAHATLSDFERIRAEIDPENREIGILINNAGVFPTEVKRFLRHDPEDIRQMIATNVNGTVMTTRYIMTSLVDRNRGLVINVASNLGRFSSPYLGVYCATKAFICSFSDSLRMEYFKHRVEVLNLLTGPVYTNLMTGWTNNFSSSLYRIVAPAPQDYARSVLALAGRTSGDSAGYWFHALMNTWSDIFDIVGVRKMLYAANVSGSARVNKLSPVSRRRK